MRMILIFLGGLLITSCTAQTNVQLLIGKWRLSEIKEDTTGQGGEPLLFIPAVEGDTLNPEPPVVPDITLSFSHGGSATMNNFGEVSQVKYVFQKKKLTIGNIKYQIEKITQTDLILKEEDSLWPSTLYFKREK